VWRPAVARAAAINAQVPAALRIHDLRHRHAAYLLNKTHNVRAVQMRLGHSSSKTTLDIYGHLLDDSDVSMAAAIDAVLPGLVPEGTEQVTNAGNTHLPVDVDVDDNDDLAI
jgi:hypothetical protein